MNDSLELFTKKFKNKDKKFDEPHVKIFIIL